MNTAQRVLSFARPSLRQIGQTRNASGSKIAQAKTELDAAYSEYQLNLLKFTEKGNKSAGTRARKALLDMKTSAHAMRQAINDAKGK